MKKLQNNFTTPEQSKRLLELGVPADSADQVYYEDIMWGAHEFLSPEHPYSETVKGHENIATPCWSVGRLIEIICNCHIITNQLVENWICCDKNTNLIELLIIDIEIYTDVQHIDFSKLED